MFSKVKARKRDDFGLRIADFRSGNNFTVEQYASFIVNKDNIILP
jgi:hypothetical protein